MSVRTHRRSPIVPALLGKLLLVVGAGFPAVLSAQAAPAGTQRFQVAAEGNEARYRVREQLAGVNFPNDAVGATTGVTGQVVLDANGRVRGSESSITVDVTTLKSDRDRRDNYVRTRTLETATHPTVVLVPTELRGLPWPLPASGSITFQLVGNLTVRGVTRSTTWDVTLQVDGAALTGTARTTFTFEDFTMTKPRVPVVLSVDDTITLEYDLRLVRQ